MQKPKEPNQLVDHKGSTDRSNTIKKKILFRYKPIIYLPFGWCYLIDIQDSHFAVT